MTYKNVNHTALHTNNATWTTHEDPEKKHSKYVQCLKHHTPMKKYTYASKVA